VLEPHWSGTHDIIFIRLKRIRLWETTDKA
jgi:hypothetical protein